MAQGLPTWFEAASEKYARGTIDLDSHTFKAVLLGSAQALTAGFAGGSGDCRYADLTAELATANGYTAGGLALTGVTISRTAGVNLWTASNLSWTLSAPITFKYLGIYDDTATNDDLLCFMDLDVGGTTVTASMSPLVFIPPVTGILGWHT